MGRNRPTEKFICTGPVFRNPGKVWGGQFQGFHSEDSYIKARVELYINSILELVTRAPCLRIKLAF